MYPPWPSRLKPSCLVVAIMLVACILPFSAAATTTPGAESLGGSPDDDAEVAPLFPRRAPVPRPVGPLVAGDESQETVSPTSEQSSRPTRLISLSDVFLSRNENPAPAQHPQDKDLAARPPSSSQRFAPGGRQDAFFRVAHRWSRKLRHRRDFHGEAAKRNPRFADHNEPVYLTSKMSGRTLIVTSDGKVAATDEHASKDGEILRRVVGGDRPMGNTSVGPLYYLESKTYDRYICINRNRSYFTSKDVAEECKFKIITHPNNFQSYCSARRNAESLKNPDSYKWCIGINRSGKLRPMNPTKQRALFLAREVNANSTPMNITPDYFTKITTSKTKPRQSNKGRKKNGKKRKKNRRRKKKEKCEEKSLFSRKCPTNISRKYKGRNREWFRWRLIPSKRPFESNKPDSSFFSKQ